MTLLFVVSRHDATWPQMSGFAGTVDSGLSRPKRLRSPQWRSEGLSNAASESSSDSRRRPLPLYSRDVSVPASQNDAPLGPPRRACVSAVRPVAPESCLDAQKFALPAPPA